MSLAVEIRGATKRFGAVTALDGVDLAVEQGEIHALVGENGAGKTTLMKALYGAQPLSEGAMTLFGQPFAPASSKAAIRAGVGMVSQHYGILGELSCLQNLILGAEEGALLSTDTKMARAEQLARDMGFPFDWDAPASTLSPTGAQRLEILKLLWRGAKVMILDEPTAMLSPADGEALFGSLTKLVRDEGATVILVTHRLPEVFGYCRNVTVLRGGKRVAGMPVSETNPNDLAKQIVGGELREAIARELIPDGSTVEASSVPKTTPTVLEVKDLSVVDAQKNPRLRDVSLAIKAGEVVGVAGVDGNGQRELFQAILGIVKSSGTVRIADRDLTKASIADRISAGVRLIAEDRLEEAVIEGWSLEENAALGFQRHAPYAHRGLIDRKARRTRAEWIADRFGTRRGSLSSSIASLSGGNQQRFVAARVLADDPRVILAFQPARGLDLNSTVDVYNGIRQQCEPAEGRPGTAALVVSFDLDELLTHCDRVVVLSHGHLSEPAPDEAHDRNAIGRLMVGAA